MPFYRAYFCFVKIDSKAHTICQAEKYQEKKPKTTYLGELCL